LRTHDAVLIDPGDEIDELLGAAFEADVRYSTSCSRTPT